MQRRIGSVARHGVEDPPYSHILALTAIDLLLTILVIAAGLGMKLRPTFARAIGDKTPHFLFVIVCVALMSVSAVNVAFLGFRFDRRFTADLKYASKQLRISVALNGLRVALFALLFMYGAGLVQEAAQIAARMLTFLSARTSYAITTVLAWVVSGIMGNAAYDLLRRMFLPRKKPGARRGASSPAARKRARW